MQLCMLSVTAKQVFRGIDSVGKCCCRESLERTAAAYKVEADGELTQHIVITQHGVCLSAAPHRGDT